MFCFVFYNCFLDNKYDFYTKHEFLEKGLLQPKLTDLIGKKPKDKHSLAYIKWTNGVAATNIANIHTERDIAACARYLTVSIEFCDSGLLLLHYISSTKYYLKKVIHVILN